MKTSAPFFSLTKDEVNRVIRYGFYYFSDIWLLWFTAPDNLKIDSIYNTTTTLFFFLFGALFFGYICDIKGRKFALSASIATYLIAQTICTILIGYAISTANLSEFVKYLYGFSKDIVIFGIAGGLGSSLVQVVEDRTANKRTAFITIFTAIGMLGMACSCLVELTFGHITQNAAFGKLVASVLGILVAAIALVLVIKYEKRSSVGKESTHLLNLKNINESFSALAKFSKYLFLIFCIGMPTFFVVFVVKNASAGFCTIKGINVGLSQQEIGLWSLLAEYIGIAFGGMILGFYSERVKTRKIPFIVANIYMALILFLIGIFPFNGNILFFFIFVFLLGLGVGSWALILMYTAEIPVIKANRGIVFFLPPNLVRLSPIGYMIFIYVFIGESNWSNYCEGISPSPHDFIDLKIFLIFLLTCFLSFLSNVMIENNFFLNLANPLTKNERNIQFLLNEKDGQKSLLKFKEKFEANQKSNPKVYEGNRTEYFKSALEYINDDMLQGIYSHNFYLLKFFDYKDDKIKKGGYIKEVHGILNRTLLDAKEHFILESNFKEMSEREYNFITWFLSRKTKEDFLLIYNHSTRLDMTDTYKKHIKSIYARDISDIGPEIFAVIPEQAEALKKNLQNHLSNASYLETSYFLYIIKPNSTKEMPRSAFVLLMSEYLTLQELSSFQSIFTFLLADLPKPS